MFDHIQLLAIIGLLFSFALKIFWICLGIYGLSALRQGAATLRRIAAAQEQTEYHLRTLSAREDSKPAATKE